MNNLFVYPNPNNGQFTVRYYTDRTSFGFLRHILLFNSDGQKVYDKTFPVTAPYSSMPVDIRNLAKGIYNLVLTDFDGKVLSTTKVITQ